MKIKQQNGSTLISVLVLLIGLMLILSCYDPDKVPESLRGVIPKPNIPIDNNSYPSATDNQGRYLPPMGTYAVQVLATQSRTEAEQFQRALKKDDYPARVEMDRYANGVVYYKVRIGTYQQRRTASDVKERILRTYAKHFSDSFVYHY